LASDFSLAFDGCGLPESAAALGVHVDSFARHLPQPEVADVVESAITSFSCGMAVGSLSSRLAGNGCRCFLGCETTRIAASSQGLALGRRSKPFSAQSYSGL